MMKVTWLSGWKHICNNIQLGIRPHGSVLGALVHLFSS